MNEETENIIRKVRKLLALGDENKNGHEAEALAAMAKARSLMTEHNLSMSEVQVTELKNEGAVDKAANFRKGCVPWERSLGGAVARLFDTQTYRHSKYVGNGKHEYAMSFVGVGADAEISSLAYESLHETLERMGRNSGFSGSERGAFLLGVAQRLGNRARDMADEAKRAQAVTTCRDLVLVKEAIINTYCEEKLHLRSIKSGNMGGSSSSHRAGYNAGGTIDLNFRKSIT